MEFKVGDWVRFRTDIVGYGEDYLNKRGLSYGEIYTIEKYDAFDWVVLVEDKAKDRHVGWEVSNLILVDEIEMLLTKKMEQMK